MQENIEVHLFAWTIQPPFDYNCVLVSDAHRDILGEYLRIVGGYVHKVIYSDATPENSVFMSSVAFSGYRRGQKIATRARVTEIPTCPAVVLALNSLSGDVPSLVGHVVSAGQPVMCEVGSKLRCARVLSGDGMCTKDTWFMCRRATP